MGGRRHQIPSGLNVMTRDMVGSASTGYRGRLASYGAVASSMGGRGGAAGLGVGGDLGGRTLGRWSQGFGGTGSEWEDELRGAAHELALEIGPTSQVVLLGPVSDRVVGVLFSGSEGDHDEAKLLAAGIADEEGFEIVSLRQGSPEILGNSFVGFSLPGVEGDVGHYLAASMQEPAGYGAVGPGDETGADEGSIDLDVEIGGGRVRYSGDTLSLTLLTVAAGWATLMQARAGR